jgi:hypothetical protein
MLGEAPETAVSPAFNSLILNVRGRVSVAACEGLAVTKLDKPIVPTTAAVMVAPLKRVAVNIYAVSPKIVKKNELIDVITQ